MCRRTEEKTSGVGNASPNENAPQHQPRKVPETSRLRRDQGLGAKVGVIMKSWSPALIILSAGILAALLPDILQDALSKCSFVIFWALAKLLGLIARFESSGMEVSLVLWSANTYVGILSGPYAVAGFVEYGPDTRKPNFLVGSAVLGAGFVLITAWAHPLLVSCAFALAVPFLFLAFLTGGFLARMKDRFRAGTKIH